MPLYEYECPADGARFERFVPIEQRDNVFCAEHSDVKARRGLPRISTPTGATESAQEALRNEGYDLAHPTTLAHLHSQIAETQRALEGAMERIKQTILPA